MKRLFNRMYLVFVCLLACLTVYFAIVHVNTRMDVENAGVVLAGYACVLVWALYRIYSLVRAIRNEAEVNDESEK